MNKSDLSRNGYMLIFQSFGPDVKQLLIVMKQKQKSSGIYIHTIEKLQWMCIAHVQNPKCFWLTTNHLMEEKDITDYGMAEPVVG